VRKRRGTALFARLGAQLRRLTAAV
jgi:hypothetical protein